MTNEKECAHAGSFNKTDITFILKIHSYTPTKLQNVFKNTIQNLSKSSLDNITCKMILYSLKFECSCSSNITASF